MIILRGSSIQVRSSNSGLDITIIHYFFLFDRVCVFAIAAVISGLLKFFLNNISMYQLTYVLFSIFQKLITMSDFTSNPMFKKGNIGHQVIHFMNITRKLINSFNFFLQLVLHCIFSICI